MLQDKYTEKQVSSAMAEMAAQCCTSRIVKRFIRLISFWVKNRREAHVCSHRLLPKTIVPLQLVRTVVGSESYRFGWIDAHTRCRVMQGHSFCINGKNVCNFLLVNNTKLVVSRTVCKIWRIIGRIFAVDRRVLALNAPIARGEPLNSGILWNVASSALATSFWNLNSWRQGRERQWYTVAYDTHTCASRLL